MHRSFRLGAILRDDYAFARSEPVRFDHNRGVELSECRDPRFDRLHAKVASSGNTKASHELLGMDLAAFELRCILGRPDDLAIDGAELVDDASHQRNLRTDNGETGIDRVRRSQIIRGCEKLTEFRDARIARCAVDLMTFLRQAPSNCVLTAAAADDENLHGRTASLQRQVRM